MKESVLAMPLSKNHILCLFLLGICLAGGIILSYWTERPSPSYAMLRGKDGKAYRLQGVNIQALYERFLYIENVRKLIGKPSWRKLALMENIEGSDLPVLVDEGDLRVSIYDQKNGFLAAESLCLYLPFTVWAPEAPLTCIKDCIGEEDRLLFYRNQPEWNNEKDLIYKALDSREVVIVKYLVEQKYHRNRNMERLAPIWYARRIHFDAGVHVLESVWPHNRQPRD